MGQQQSKDELLFKEACLGNIETIKALHSDGAGLEWIDKEGKTPLIMACLDSRQDDVAKTLIELGANVNAYRRGRHGGTPLHHAAKRGLENTVKLLLSHGANPLLKNDDHQAPIEIARAKGHTNIVRVIESGICLFSGWMREFHGPGFLEVLAPRFAARKVWVVVLPSSSGRTPSKSFKLELAVYTSLEDARPRGVVALWKADVEEPKLNQPDPSMNILDNSTMTKGRRRKRSTYTSKTKRKLQVARQTRIKLAPGIEGDKQQLQRFYDACKGISPSTHPVLLLTSKAPTVQATAPPESDDPELALAINASLQSAAAKIPLIDGFSDREASASNSSNHAVNTASQNVIATSLAYTVLKESGTGAVHSENLLQMQNNSITCFQSTIHTPAPSAPPITDDLLDEGLVQYPVIYSSPVDSTSPANKCERKEDEDASLCAICLDGPSEAACIPCGHVAGCMACLKEVKSKNWGCPVCRAKIDQLIKLYRV